MIGRVYLFAGARWRVVCRAEPFDTRRGGPARNVLIEHVETGERMVRPFRGLRKGSPGPSGGTRSVVLHG